MQLKFRATFFLSLLSLGVSQKGRGVLTHRRKVWRVHPLDRHALYRDWEEGESKIKRTQTNEMEFRKERREDASLYTYSS